MIPKKVNVCGYTFKVVRKKQLGGSIDLDKLEIIIGTNYVDKISPLELLIHEISEAIHILMDHRFFNYGNNSHMFFFSHSGFENHNSFLVRTLIDNKIISV